MNDKLIRQTVSRSFRFTSRQKLSFGFGSKMQTSRKVVLFGLLFALSLCIFTAPSLAQSPSWSRGIQNLSISFDECKSRARRALEAEGYTIENQGGGNQLNSPDHYLGGYKEVHNAVIACSSAPDGKTWANIFVASCLSTRNGDVPGAERVKLQERMNQSGYQPDTDYRRSLVNHTFEQFDNGNKIGTVTFFSDGTAKHTYSNLPHSWKIEANGDLMIYAGGTLYVARLKFDAATGTFSGARDRTSQTQDGVRTVLRPVNR
jgi:hypothetical protein